MCEHDTPKEDKTNEIQEGFEGLEDLLDGLPLEEFFNGKSGVGIIEIIETPFGLMVSGAFISEGEAPTDEAGTENTNDFETGGGSLEDGLTQA